MVAPDEEAEAPRRKPKVRERLSPGALAGAVRCNKAISVLVLIGILLRIGVFIAYRPALVLYGDSFAYLANAKHLVPSPIHPLGYAVVLRVLDATGSLAAVTVFQHLLSLGLGIGTYVLLKRLGLPSWLAAAAAAPALLDAYQVGMGQFLLAEVTFEVLLLAGLAAVIASGHGWRAAGVGGLLLALATTTRVVGLFVLLLAGGSLVLRRVGWRPLVAFAVAAALPLVAYASWYDAAHGQFALGGNSSRFMWAKVAPISHCYRDHMPRDLRWLCLKGKVGHRPTTEFLDWNAQSPYFTHHASVAEKDEQAQQFARHVVLHEPVAYTRLVARDVVHYFRWTRTTDYIDWPVQTWLFLDPLQPYSWHSGTVSDNPDQAVYRQPLPFDQPAHQPASWLRVYQWFGFVPGPLLALLALLGIAGAVWGRAQTEMRVWVGGLLLAVSGLVLLLQPAATVPLDYRYLLPAMLLFAPAGALGLHALLPRLRRLAVSRRLGREVPADA